MIHGQRVRITDGTYHSAEEKPYGKIVGETSLSVGPTWVRAYVVELEKFLSADSGKIEIMHLVIGAQNLTEV